MLLSSKVYYVRSYGGKGTLVIEGSLIHKAIQSMDSEAGHVQDGNKMSVFTANMMTN